MATRIKSSQIADGAIVAADLHSAIAINTTQSGTFGSVIVDDITLDGSSLTTSGTNDFTVDSGGLIVLDADSNGDIRLANSAGQYASLYNSGDHLYVKAIINEGDVYLSGKDSNGAHINGLRLDFGNSGRATFAENVGVTGDIDITGNTKVGGLSVITSARNIGNVGNINIGGYYAMDGTTLIDVNKNLINIASLTTTGNVDVGGNVVITGNLQVDGTTTTVNSTTLDVADLNITVAKNSANAAAADGAGLTVDDGSGGTEPTILYGSTPDSFNFNRNVGINTTITGGTTADTYLHIYSNESNITPLIKLQNNTGENDNSEGVSIDFVASGDKTAVGSRIIGTRAAAGANMDLRFHTARDGFAMIIDENKQVGIGTTDPSLKLDVATSSGAAGSFNRHLALTRGTTTGGFLGTYRAAANNDVDRMSLGIGTTPTVTISSNLLDVTGGIRASEVRHNVRPSLLLDFANSKRLDPRMSFTRSSTGTYWDGTMIKAEENLIMGSNDLTTGWSYNNTTKTTGHTAPDSTTTAVGLDEDTTTNTFHFGVESISAYSSSDYVFSVYAKSNERSAVYLVIRTDSGSKRYAVNFNLSNGTFIDDFNYGGPTGTGYSIESVGNGWYRCSVKATNTAGDVIVCVGPNDGNTLADINGSYAGTVGHGIYAWGAQLEKRSSPTQYTQTTTTPTVKYQPVLRSAPANYPRFDHDPATGESLGILIEEARTNYAPYSTPNSNWAKAAQMISSDYAIAPDGTHTAGFIHESATSTQQLSQTNAGNVLTSGSTYTFSVYAKAYTHDTFEMHSYGDSSKTFNLSSPSNSSDSTMTHVGNDWYRCTWRKTKTNTTGSLYLGFSGSSYAGDPNKGLLFWGAQLELGTFATSLIPTVGSTNTRSLEELADYNLEYSSNRQSWFSSYQGTMFADYTLFGSYTDAPYPRIHITTNVGSRTSIEMMHYGGNVHHNFFLDNSLKHNQNRSVAVNNRISGAMSWDFTQNLASSAINGTANNSTINGVPHQLDRLYLGTSGWNGHIRKFAFYRDHFSNAELVALTEE